MLHLAERRTLRLQASSLRTPLVVPSFSSRIPDVEKVFTASKEFLDGAFLVSAYDLANRHLSPPYDFAGPLFLDSGGYEIASESDLSDVSSDPSGGLADWNADSHRAVISDWAVAVPTVIVSYDHPSVRVPIPEQIDRARTLVAPHSDCGIELLIKPETKDQKFVQIDAVLKYVRDLSPFCAIGVTEKEVGNSVLERMIHIAQLRVALRKIDLNIPIHVFGSLDTITTLFYFVVGADIFDGLTWLRYAFKEGHTVYRQDYGIGEFGIATKSPKVEALCWAKNYHYIKDMELEMRRFLNEHDFRVFRYHSEQLKAAYESVQEEVTT